jgi:hypothetical protein
MPSQRHSKGQFYTPAEVSRVIAQVIGIYVAKTSNDTTVYDPTCGSGSLLLKVADEARTPVSLFGQDKDAGTAGLARMNMILHNNPTALIVQGNCSQFRTEFAADSPMEENGFEPWVSLAQPRNPRDGVLEQGWSKLGLRPFRRSGMVGPQQGQLPDTTESGSKSWGSSGSDSRCGVSRTSVC